MRILSLLLLGGVLVIQYPLWLGKGGWLKVWEMGRNLEERRTANDRLQARNDALAAEVANLKEGFEAIEERARSELGMVREGEIYYQVWTGQRP